MVSPDLSVGLARGSNAQESSVVGRHNEKPVFGHVEESSVFNISIFGRGSENLAEVSIKETSDSRSGTDCNNNVPGGRNLHLPKFYGEANSVDDSIAPHILEQARATVNGWMGTMTHNHIAVFIKSLIDNGIFDSGREFSAR